MIGFFRRIRRKLSNENRFLQYSRYAIGEIVLVMVGILLALQVNNWNENKNKRIQELKYLNGIKLDLQKDLISLGYHTESRINQIKSARQIIEHIEGKQIENYVALNNMVFDIVASGHFEETNITFDELKNSGNLNIISNDSIKMLLLELHSLYEENKATREHELYDYNNYISIPYFNTVDLYPSLLINENSKKKGNVKKEQLNTLLKSVAFKNGCVNTIWMSKIYLSSFPNIKENSLLLIKLVDDELNR